MPFLAILSMCVTLVMTVLKLFDAMEFIKLAGRSEELANRCDARVDAKDLNAATQRKVWVVYVGCALLVCSLVYATVKVVMAHLCEDAMWNISGCIVLHM